MYSKKELLQGLKTKTLGGKLFVFETIDSTNTCAKTLTQAGADEGAVVIADFQTNGRGRQGRPWVSLAGTGLLFSVILRPILPKEKAGFLAFFAAVSIARAVEAATKLTAECKWPNDVLLGGKKCCGLLLENSVQNDRVESSILGIGLNVNQQAFEGELAGRATSLRIETGKEFDRIRLFRELLMELDSTYWKIKEGQFDWVLEEWNSRCLMFGRPVSLSHANQTVSGIAVELSADGGLVLETSRGRATYYAGDVTMSV
ncbi:MAG: biotin--[acetyl-CoA-carboxylase] ligase [Bacteroidota bacterium]